MVLGTSLSARYLHLHVCAQERRSHNPAETLYTQCMWQVAGNSNMHMWFVQRRERYIVRVKFSVK